MVLLRTSGPEVPERFPHEPSDPGGILEVDGEGSARRLSKPCDRHEEDIGLLSRSGAAGDKDGLGDARVSSRRQGMRGHYGDPGDNLMYM